MKATLETLRLLGISLLGIFGSNLIAAPMGTAFTYQGVATDNGSPATGLYDVRCELFDESANGMSIGPTLDFPNSTTDSNGVFSVALDFGPGAFNGQARWLQFSVRPAGSAEPFTVLSPRQQLTPAPAALWATTAQNLAGNLATTQITGDFPSSRLSGVIPSGLLSGTYPSAVIFNNAVNSFSGNGVGLMNVNADLLDGEHGSSFARLYGDTYFNDIAGSRLKIGSSHTLDGTYATIPGGYQNEATGNYSFAAGYRAKAKHAGSFVWADNTAADFASAKNNSFLIRAAGGVGINTNDPSGALGVVSATRTAIHGTTSQLGGMAVAGWASDNTSDFRNYGGSFGASGINGVGVKGEASGTAGIGVWGYATSTSSGTDRCGGYFEADGLECKGVYARASAPGGIGVYSYGGTAGYDFYASGPGSNYGSGSSIRWKKDIRPIDEPLAKVMALRGVYFNWDSEHGGNHDIGMIAEEVGKVLPEIVVYEKNGVDATGMDYSKMTPLLVEACKALSAQVNELRRQEAEKDARIDSLENDIKELRAALNTLIEQAEGGKK